MSDNVTEILTQIQNTFSEFKNANDTRLAEIESKGAADPLLEEKVNRINDAITALEVKVSLPQIETADDAADEYKSAYIDFVRKGTEIKATSGSMTATGDPVDGGYALPKIIEKNLYTALQTLSPIRALADVVTISSNDYRFLVNNADSAAGWVGETDARTATGSPTIAEIQVAMGEVYANIAASQRSLDDLSFGVDAFLVNEISRKFAAMEGTAFVTGTGTNMPKGFMATTLAQVKTGAAATLPTNGDFIINMTQALAAPYRAGAAWLANASTVATVRTIKDTTNNYLWQPSLVAGTPATLNGYPIYECEDMASAAANALPMVFANLKLGYLIADRTNVTLLRDPYSNKPYVSFYATKRVGGIVRDAKAFVTLKCSV